MNTNRSCRAMAIAFFLIEVAVTASARETWQTALSEMPLPAGVRQLDKSNCVGIMLGGFQSNRWVKGLVFMPSATDEFYFFKRAKAFLTNASPTLLDAVTALTNQTLIRATFLPPLLILHTSEDLVRADFYVENPATARRLESAKFVPHALYNDRDWDYLDPILTRRCSTWFFPRRGSPDSWHFYRHSFAGWNLTCREALQAISLAGQTTFTIQKRSIVFWEDNRKRPTPATLLRE